MAFSNSTIIIAAIIGSSGLIGAVVAIVKLRPDINSQAVIDSKAALEQMMMLQTELRRDRDDWRERTRGTEHQIDGLREENKQQFVRIMQLENEARVLAHKLHRLQDSH